MSARPDLDSDNITHEGGLVKVLESGRKFRSGGVRMMLSHLKDCIEVSEGDYGQTLVRETTLQRENLAVLDLVGSIFVAFFASDAW